MPTYQIFDFHTHVYPERIADRAVDSLGKFYNVSIEGDGTYADLEASSKRNGISGFLMLGVATNAHQVEKVNDGMAAALRTAREHGMLAAAFAGMHQDYERPAAELDRALGLGLSGVKIHPDIQGVDIDDSRFFPLYEAMEKRNVPLYLHMGDERPQYPFSKAEKLLHMLERFPRLRVMAAHLGGYTAWDEAHLLAGHPHIWFDSSSSLWCMSPERASDLIHMLGADRVMFGTDYPMCRADGEVKRFFAIPNLTDAEKKAILYDNAISFLGL